jgi:hypothetical protein
MSADPLRVLPLAIAVGAVVLLAGAGAETFDFMPRGGRALLLEVAGPAPAQWREAVQQKRSEDEWRQWASQSPRGKALSDKEQATLAAYLAVNMPTPVADAAALPLDGRDLSWEQCQSCHSLFAGFLTQQGSATRWRNMFLAPFHRNMKMSPQQREEFARYAEINMPMKVEDVPAELRF